MASCTSKAADDRTGRRLVLYRQWRRGVGLDGRGQDSAVTVEKRWCHHKGILAQECKETADLLLFFDKLFDSYGSDYCKVLHNLIVEDDCQAPETTTFDLDIQSIPDVQITDLSEKKK
ncbi:Parathyroid hormone-responsive B1 [Operophtera brumata]|uniref:Parathyroid hormone-responsive B1 n=1 Tax=Operophtera brumata TaxID=104452 RepID=A0A0L7K4Z7_OPEBR|nr:Parathyroid hormone-responsive B1 [Operophtera brumata]